MELLEKQRLKSKRLTLELLPRCIPDTCLFGLCLNFSSDKELATSEDRPFHF